MAQFKGDSYIGGSLGVAKNVNIGNKASGLIVTPEYPILISAPRGGSYFSDTASVTGAIRIRLPTYNKTHQIKFKVSIFDATNDQCLELWISGVTASFWLNTTAILLTSVAARALSVRFGYFVDGGTNYNAVYIGEVSSTWAYPNARVHDVLVGSRNLPAEDEYIQNWSIAMATSLGTISVTETATPPIAKWG